MEVVPPPPDPFVSTSLGAAAEPREPTSSGSRFAEVLEALGQRVDDGERLMDQVVRARGSMNPSELIALQAGIYRYSEAVELAAKLVDRAGNAIKTTLQSQ